MSSPDFSRLATFLDTTHLETEQGGKKTGGWRKRLTTLFLSISFMLGGIAALDRPVADDLLSRKTYKNYITESQKEVDAIKGNRPIAIMDRSPSQIKTEIIAQNMRAVAARHGIKNVPVKYAPVIYLSMMSSTGYAFPIYNGSDTMPVMGVVAPMHALTTAREKMQSYANLPPSIFLREDLPITTYQSAMFTCWHEAFGHSTEDSTLAAKNLPCTSYRRHLQEVRADIAATICMARLEGHTYTARSIAMIRDIGIHSIFSFGRDTWIQEDPERACIYNLGPTSRMACDRIDHILADPAKAKAFREMTPTQVVAMTNELFSKFKPSQENFSLNSAMIRDAILQDTDQTIKDRIDSNDDQKLQTELYLKSINHSMDHMLSPLRKEPPISPVLSPPMPVPANPGI